MGLTFGRKTFRLSDMLEPAHSVITKLGGYAAAHKKLGLGKTTVYAWSRPPDTSYRGAGGSIPDKHWRKILDVAARECPGEITIADLIPIECRPYLDQYVASASSAAATADDEKPVSGS